MSQNVLYKNFGKTYTLDYCPFPELSINISFNEFIHCFIALKYATARQGQTKEKYKK